MNRKEILTMSRELLLMMQLQVKRSVIDVDFFWRLSGQFNRLIDVYAVDIYDITFEEYCKLIELHSQVKDSFEVAAHELYPERTPLFVSRVFRDSPKGPDGCPLEPVQLCSLLEQEIFKELPVIGQQEENEVPGQVQVVSAVEADSTTELPEPAGSVKPVAFYRVLGSLKPGTAIARVHSFQAWRLMACPDFRREAFQ